jgi:hypothetical protein
MFRVSEIVLKTFGVGVISFFGLAWEEIFEGWPPSLRGRYKKFPSNGYFKKLIFM